MPETDQADESDALETDSADEHPPSGRHILRASRTTRARRPRRLAEEDRPDRHGCRRSLPAAVSAESAESPSEPSLLDALSSAGRRAGPAARRAADRPSSASCAARPPASAWSTAFMPSFRTTSKTCCLKVQRPIFIDLIQLHDDIGKMIAARASDRFRRRRPRLVPRNPRIDSDRDRRHPLPPGRRAVLARNGEFDPRKQRRSRPRRPTIPRSTRRSPPGCARVSRRREAHPSRDRHGLLLAPAAGRAAMDSERVREAFTFARAAQSWARSLVAAWKFSQSSTIPSHEPSWAKSASKTSRSRAVRSAVHAAAARSAPARTP